MRPETAACLYDMARAAERISEATHGLDFSEYEADWKIQSAVERQFGTLGEAIVRIRDLELPIFEQIPDRVKIVAFRNLLVHAYDAIDPKRVWAISKDLLPDLQIVLEQLLAEARGQGL